jgi:hypothetical protein
MAFVRFFFATLFATAAVQAKNDWSKPCFAGKCSYTSGDGVKTAYSTLSLNGGATTISDISEASGWKILGCDSKSAHPQSIRLVCASNDMSAKGCGHLFEGGAQHTIIRLPESCGKGPFARVSRVSLSNDQSIPDKSLDASLRKNGSTPQVHALDFDYNFKDIPSANGKVSFHIEASNVPPPKDNSVSSPHQARGTELSTRGWWDFDENEDKNLTPLDISKSLTLLDKSISCPQNGNIPAFTGQVHADVNGNVHAVVSYGYTIAGSFIPPEVDVFELRAGLTASANANFVLHASATGSYDTGLKKLWSAGLPGLSITGIIDIGPIFSLNAQAKASLAAAADVTLSAAWNLNNAVLYYPPRSTQPGASPISAPLKITVTPTASITGNVEAHIIPRIDLGVEVLEGAGSATAFLGLDAWGKLDLGVSASASAGTGTGGSSASGSVQGCIDLNAGFDIPVGVQYSLPFFGDKTYGTSLYSYKRDLYNKCWSAASKRSTLPAAKHFEERDVFTCPASTASPVTLVNQNV